MTMVDVEEHWAHQRRMLDRMADYVDEWQGFPVAIPDVPLTLHDRHPLRDLYRDIDDAGEEIKIVVGGPEDDGTPERVVNWWRSRSSNYEVYVFHRDDPERGTRAFGVKVLVAPDGSMARLKFWLTTIGAADAWDLDAEERARVKLRGMLSERQWRHYDLTGCFLETSPRSKLTYLFRRLRPTVVLSPRGRDGKQDEMLLVAALCFHSVGYYRNTWGGCLVPSDDVVSALLWMRGDEAGFWRTANQHRPSAPEAGL